MPIVHSIIPETETHILFPIAKQVAHHIVDSLGITNRIKNNIFIDTGWTTVKGTRDDHKFRIRSNSLQMSVSLSNINSQKWEYTNKMFYNGYGISHSNLDVQFPLVLNDREANIKIYEMYLPCTMNCECRFWFVNRNYSYEMIDRLQHLFPNNTMSTITLAYDYPVPKDILALLCNLYKLRKFDNGEIPFNQYLGCVGLQRFDLANSRTGKYQELVIEKNLDNSLLNVEHSIDKPNENKINKTTEYYEIPINVTLQFQRASALLMKYPIIVDNTLVPEIFIPNTGRNHEYPIASSNAHHPIKSVDRVDRRFRRVHKDQVRFPFYDDWMFRCETIYNRTYQPFVIMAYTLDEGVDTVIDLNNLPDDYELHPVVKYVLSEQGNESFRFDSIFNISLFSNDDFLDPSTFKFNNLIITTKSTDIHPLRHIVISEIWNYHYLNPKWFYLLELFKGFFYPSDHPGYIQYKNTAIAGGYIDSDQLPNETIREYIKNGIDTTFRIYWNRLIPRSSSKGN